MTDKQPWLNADDLIAVFMRPEVSTDEDAAEHYRQHGHQVSRRAITDARNAIGLPAKSKAKLFNIDSESLPKQSKDKKEIWNLVAKLQMELRKEVYAKRDIHINLETNDPVGMFFAGDLHIGDIGTDHQALLRDVERIQQTEGLYGTLGGDYINNFINPGGRRKIANHEILPVEFAWELTADLFDRLKDSLWAILIGNHDNWTYDAADIDKLGQIVRDLGVPYGFHGCNVHITYPTGQSYKVRLRHKYRFESSVNILNAVKQMWRWDEQFDVGVLHHLHQPGVEAFLAPERGQCWAIRPGSYKVEDDWGFERGFHKTGVGMSTTFGTDKSCQYSIPVAIFWPNERRIHVSTSITEGIEYLDFAKDRVKGL